MEQDDGFGLRIRSRPEVDDVAIKAETTDDGGARRSADGKALVAESDFAVVAMDHMYTTDKGDVAADLNGLEKALLKCMLEHNDFVCWLRNPPVVIGLSLFLIRWAERNFFTRTS